MITGILQSLESNQLQRYQRCLSYCLPNSLNQSNDLHIKKALPEASVLNPPHRSQHVKGDEMHSIACINICGDSSSFIIKIHFFPKTFQFPPQFTKRKPLPHSSFFFFVFFFSRSLPLRQGI